MCHTWEATLLRCVGIVKYILIYFHNTLFVVCQDTRGQQAQWRLPEPPQVEARLPEARLSSHEFARNLIWTFEDIRMLIGSDMPIFGDDEHPSISLRLLFARCWSVSMSPTIAAARHTTTVR